MAVSDAVQGALFDDGQRGLYQLQGPWVGPYRTVAREEGGRVATQLAMENSGGPASRRWFIAYRAWTARQRAAQREDQC